MVGKYKNIQKQNSQGMYLFIYDDMPMFNISVFY